MSKEQVVRLVTSGQGIRASCTHSFPLATGPTGKPSLPGTELSMVGGGRKTTHLRLSCMNVPLPLMGYRYLKLIIKEVDMEKDHHPLLLFHFYFCAVY